MLAYVVLMGVWGLLGIPAAVIAIPWTLLTRDLRLLYWSGITVMRIGLGCAGIRTVVSGREKVPRGEACLFLANHQSNLDPPMIAIALPVHAAMMIKQSLMRIPMLGFAMRLARFVPVARSGSIENAKRGLRAAADVLASGLSLTVFPEGTRSQTGELQPLKKGPFFIAMQTGARIVPVTVTGTGAMLGKGSQRLRPGIAHITFHAPLDPAQFATRERLMEAVRSAIASALAVELTAS